jgi:fatty acid desaturase
MTSGSDSTLLTNNGQPIIVEELPAHVKHDRTSGTAANGRDKPKLRFTHEYAELKRLLQQRGLMERQPAYYATKMALALGMLAIGLTVLIVVTNPWLQLLNAVFMGFVYTQIGFMGHDVGHRQTLKTNGQNMLVGMICGNLLIGVSRGWWVDKHNRHHGHPNQIDMDPDIDFPFIAFSAEQLDDKRGLARWIVKYQAFLLVPMETLLALSLRANSIRFLLTENMRYRFVELSVIVAHVVLYLGLVFSQLSFWQALLFIFVHQATFGIYMGSVFAPNHKGMPILPADTELDFLRQQVVTARNVRPSPLTDFWYGGLNYQIEHHLFPTLPRNKLGEARAIIKDWCRDHAIDYYETGLIQSYKEILISLHEVGAPLRAKKGETTA